MSEGRRDRLEALFEEAIELPPAERAALLARAAAEDAELCAGLEALLRAHDRAGLLDRPVPGVRIPNRIGPYEVLDVLGRGGMGIVYLAERADGQFRQRVAIKVIPSDDDPDLPARMVAERQILATLDHPNIGRLLDGGVLADGLPYLVMEHVAGLPIDVYCDRMRLGVAERARLLAVVARAVEHAHRNLVVHRDLKPSNILVTTDGRPKLLDFGIAKLLNPMLAGIQSPPTRVERRALTPEYASPEQLRGESLTTTSDVYSLGVVLYRLLTGRLPHAAQPTSASMMELVLRAEPVRPSELIARDARGTEAERAAVMALARDRDTTPERLARVLRGDLDAIVLKALRSEPGRRYGSAEQLAQDLDAWLAGEPVLAHRGTRWYRAQKLAVRHKAGAIAAALVVVSLVLGAGTATWQARVARLERDRAESSRVEAQTVTEFLMEMFRSGESDGGSDGDLTADALLRRGLSHAELLSAQPLVQARMLDVVGQMHYGLSHYDDAESLLRRAVEIQRAQGELGHADLASTLVHLSWTMRARARDDEAIALVSEALAIRREHLPAGHPEIGEALFELAWLSPLDEQERLYREAIDTFRPHADQVERRVLVMLELTTNLRRQGRTSDALSNARDAVAIAQSSLGGTHPTTGRAKIHLADQVRDLLEDAGEAERLYREGLAAQESHYGGNSIRLLHGINSLAALASMLGRHEEAVELYRRGLQIREVATGPHHPAVAASLGHVALALLQGGRAVEAEADAKRSLALYEGLLGSEHPSVAAALGTLAAVNSELGRIDSATALMERALALREARGESGPLGEGWRDLGRMLTDHGRHAEAEQALLRSYRILEAGVGRDHPNTQESRRALAQFYAQRGRPDLAERYRVPPGLKYVPY